MEQRLGSTCLPDGTKLAYATAGDGPLLLFIGGWLSHLEHSWALPAERQLFECLARGRTLLRYDRPGCGLSDRPPHLRASLESELDNVAAVAAAAGVSRCDVMGSSLGVPVAIEWAARHRDTVDHLVLYGGWARGADIAPAPLREHVVGLVSSHWGLGADVLTDIFAPEASAGTRSALAAYQRQASSAGTAADLLDLCDRIDVTGSLEKVRAPTLVVHREHDRAAPTDQARLVAAGIQASQLRVLPGRSHMPYIGDVDALIAVIRDFLGLPALRRSAAPDHPPGTGRRIGHAGADQPRDRRTARHRRAVRRYRAGAIDVHEADQAMHRHHQAARELWKFCWVGGGGSHLEFVAQLIDDQAHPVNWWLRGAAR